MFKDQESFDKDIEELTDLFKDFNLKNYTSLATIRNKYSEIAASYPELIFKKNAYKFINIFDEIFLDNDEDSEEEKPARHNLKFGDKDIVTVDYLWFMFNDNDLKVMYAVSYGEIYNGEYKETPVPTHVVDEFRVPADEIDELKENLKKLAEEDLCNKKVYDYIDTHDRLGLIRRYTSNKSLLNAIYGSVK